MRIVHISDLHLSSPNYMPEWGKRVIKNVNKLHPEVLVITGDLTMDGYMHEYELVGDYFNKLKVENILVVPGNHDSRNEGFKLFEEIFETRFPKYEDENIVIIGVDSSEPDVDDGRVGREHYYLITDELSNREKITFFFLHHHLIPIPGTGREKHIASDAGDVLELVTQAKLHFVLSGHKHRPWIWKLFDTHFITAGTATTRRLKGKSYPSFNIMDIKEKKVHLSDFNVEDEVITELMNIRVSF